MLGKDHVWARVVPGRMLGADHVWARVVRGRCSGAEMMLFKATGIEQLFSVGYCSCFCFSSSSVLLCQLSFLRPELGSCTPELYLEYKEVQESIFKSLPNTQNMSPPTNSVLNNGQQKITLSRLRVPQKEIECMYAFARGSGGRKSLPNWT